MITRITKIRKTSNLVLVRASYDVKCSLTIFSHLSFGYAGLEKCKKHHLPFSDVGCVAGRKDGGFQGRAEKVK